MAVRLAAFKRSRAELELAAAIEAARRDRIPWQALGEAIGTSGEVARQRYTDQQATLPHVSFLRHVAEEALAEAWTRAEKAPETGPF